MAPCSVIGACVELFGATDGRRQQCGHPVRGGLGGARTRRCVERWRSTSSALCSAASAPSREDPRGRGTIVNVVVGALIDLPELTSYGATRSPRWPLAYPALRRERRGLLSHRASPAASGELEGLDPRCHRFSCLRRPFPPRPQCCLGSSRELQPVRMASRRAGIATDC